MSDDQDKNNKDNSASYEKAVAVTDQDETSSRNRGNTNRNPFDLASDLARHQYNSLQVNLNHLFEHSRGWVADSIDTLPNPLTRFLDAVHLPSIGRKREDQDFDFDNDNDNTEDIFGIKQFLSELSDMAEKFNDSSNDPNTFETAHGDVISVLDSSYPVPTSRQFYNCQQVFRGYSAWDHNGIWRCLFLNTPENQNHGRYGHHHCHRRFDHHHHHQQQQPSEDEGRFQENYFSKQLQTEVEEGGLKNVFFSTYNNFLNHHNDKIVEQKRVDVERRNRLNDLIWANNDNKVKVEKAQADNKAQIDSTPTTALVSTGNNNSNGKYISEDQAQALGLTPVQSFYETKVLGENGNLVETKTVRKVYNDGSQSVMETKIERRG